MTLQEKQEMFSTLSQAYSYLSYAYEYLKKLKCYNSDEEEKIIKECMAKLQSLAR